MRWCWLSPMDWFSSLIHSPPFYTLNVLISLQICLISDFPHLHESENESEIRATFIVNGACVGNRHCLVRLKAIQSLTFSSKCKHARLAKVIIFLPYCLLYQTVPTQFLHVAFWPDRNLCNTNRDYNHIKVNKMLKILQSCLRPRPPPPQLYNLTSGYW